MRVLVACEFSGIVRDAFIERGHEAISCDLLPSERPGPHIEGDVRPHLRESWDLIIAHPPCTRLCNTGVRWLNKPPGGKLKEDMWDELRESAVFFNELLYLRTGHVGRVAVENPTMHKYARELVGRGPDFCVQPYHFGHGETKRTCFWTRGLSPLQVTNFVDERRPRSQMEPPGPDRWKRRSRTYPWIAAAMAEQWGSAGSAGIVSYAAWPITSAGPRRNKRL